MVFNTAACSFFEKLYDFKQENVESVSEPMTLADNAPDGGVFHFDDSVMSTVPSEVLEVAKSSFESFRQKESGLHFNLLSIHEKSEMEKATLGIPYEILYIPEEYVETDDQVSNIKFGKMLIWAFPIIVDGQFRGLYKIANHYGEWKWVELGATEGARRAQKLEMKENIVGVAKRRAFVNSYSRPVGFIGYADINETIEEGEFYSGTDKKLENKVSGIEEIVDITSEFPTVDGN